LISFLPPIFPGIKEWDYPNSCSNNNNGNISIKKGGIQS
jgi:hypothetical protein